MANLSTLLIMTFLFVLGGILAMVLSARRSSFQSSETNFGPFQAVVEQAPFSVWAERNGEVSWCNNMCLQNFTENKAAFQGIKVFDRVGEGDTIKDDCLYEVSGVEEEKKATFTIQNQVIDGTTVYYAQDATLLAETEMELKRFVQTLSATFAHLPIGLAVFDKKRDLTLFNPALSYLLGVTPDWLARRPSMRSFLDRLRNDGAIPEPKDFTTLRQEFAKLESGAFTGMYEVDWALPSGAIYRVTGRPHPQGGAALLFEDITKSSALEAGFRSELLQWHTAFEALSDAIAVFNQAGELSFANDAFDALWECSLSTSVVPANVNDVTSFLQRKTFPSPVWGELRNFVHDLTERSQWTANVTLLSGRQIDLVFTPIADGRVMCEFKLDSVYTLPKLSVQ